MVSLSYGFPPCSYGCKYKVSPAHIDDIDDATNVSDTVQTIGSSEASVANPNISID